MKQLITFFLINISLYTYGQISYEKGMEFFDREIDSVLIKLQGKGFKSVEISITKIFTNKKVNVHHSFKKINDSIIRDDRKYDNDEHAYVYHYYCYHGNIKLLQREEDVNFINSMIAEHEFSSSPKTFDIESDSAGYKFDNFYTIYNGDTLNTGCSRIKKDSHGRITNHLSLDSDLKSVFEEDHLYFGDSIEYFTSWRFVNGQKILMRSDTTQSKISVSGNIKTINNIISKNAFLGETIIHFTTSSNKTLHFDVNRIIKEVNYSEINDHGNKKLKGKMIVVYK